MHPQMETDGHSYGPLKSRAFPYRGHTHRTVDQGGAQWNRSQAIRICVHLCPFVVLLDSAPLRFHREQLGYGQLEFGQQLFRQKLVPRQYAFEDQAVLVAVIDFHVVVAWIDHPQARQSHLLIDLLLDDRVGVVVIRAYNLRREPRFSRRSGHKRQVGANRVVQRKPHLRARGEQTRAGKVRHAGLYPLVETGANQLVPDAGRPARQGCTVQDLRIRRAHALARTLRRNRPVCERLLRAICSGVPCATIRPPPSPPSGPRSMTQSASAMRSRLCSMTITEWPASTNLCSASANLCTSAICSPMVGSSRMNRFRFGRRSSRCGSFRSEERRVG